jgi:hypothetical protein
MSAHCDKRVLDVVAEGDCLVWRSIAFLRSPAFRVLTAHLVLVRIEKPTVAVTSHAKFKAYGIS